MPHSFRISISYWRVVTIDNLFYILFCMWHKFKKFNKLCSVAACCLLVTMLIAVSDSNRKRSRYWGHVYIWMTKIMSQVLHKNLKQILHVKTKSKRKIIYSTSWIIWCLIASTKGWDGWANSSNHVNPSLIDM